MHSFIFEKDSNKIISAQKVIQKASSLNINPFFEYINNIKPSNLSIQQKDSKNQPSSSLSVNQQIPFSNQKKQQLISADPRRIYIPTKLTVIQNTISDSKKNQILKIPQKDNLKEKRSRSRENKKSKNRSNSQDSFKKEKKQQHFHKTKLCPLYDSGQCKKGADCNFAHGYKQLRCLPNFYKTRLCLSFQKGQCKKPTDQCKYAHGQKQLRGLKHDAGYSSTISGYDNQKNKDQKYNKNKKQRNSQSTHRNDRNDKYRRENNRHEDSKDRDRKKISKQTIYEDTLFYKKDIPVNKDYEKFLYGDNDLKASEAQNSMYMIPNPVLNPNNIQNIYSADLYSINLRKDIIPISPINTQAYPQFQRSYNDSSNKFFGSSRQQNPLPFYPKNHQNDSRPNHSFSKHKQGYDQRNSYQTKSYLPPPNNQPNYMPQYSDFYQNRNQFVPDFSKDSYHKSFNPTGYSQQPYKNDGVRNTFSNQNKFSEPVGYLPPQKVNSQRYPLHHQNQKQQSYYKNDSFYSAPSYKKNEVEVINGYSNQNKSGSYPTNFSGNGVYDLYPALDNTVNHISKSSYSHEKSMYSGFSSNTPK